MIDFNNGEQLLGYITGLVIILGVFALAVAIIPTFYDFEKITGADNTTGEIEIDQDAIDNINDNVQEFQETAFKAYNFNVLTGYLFTVFAILAMVAILAFVLKRI